MKANFQQKLILSFLIIFVVFTTGIVIFQQRQARGYKTEALQEKLDAFAETVLAYMARGAAVDDLDSLLFFLPENLRLTLVDWNGQVLFDNAVTETAILENHADRPEISEARRRGYGTFIRTSASTREPYLYYAKSNGAPYLVRVALPYDVEVRSFLKPDNVFLYFILALFLIGLGFIFYVGHYFGRSVRQLRDFSLALQQESPSGQRPDFPKDELGEIGEKLLANFRQIHETQAQLLQEKEKLLLHIQSSAEGVCFFHADRTIDFYNGLFLQYFNFLSAETRTIDHLVLSESELSQVAEFLDHRNGDDHYETRITRQAKEFLVRVNVFEDCSFEIILTDVTAAEKTRRLKQEMTGNIAHELRTPVTSIQGFLEILLNNSINGEKAQEFLRRAYVQTKNLSELISDMSMLTRMDEKQDSFERVSIDISALLEKVHADSTAALEEKRIGFQVDLPEGLTVRGNENLLYSLFRNLTENVIRYAGEDISIRIKVSGIKDGMAYFSFADNGTGIADERHLNRLFERFYRVNEGRTRDTGGSGLGLAIVKNTVQLHGGIITVKNAAGKGLEFLFTLPVSRTLTGRIKK
ncbi:MAG: ATP-binding protein [Rikenellaceae bacterium]|nr:ATP-binding protein [Rikenellaceae bacterium]